MTLSHPDKQGLAALPTQFCQIQKNPFVICTYFRDTLFLKVLKSYLPALCNHFLEHLKDFCS